MYMDNSGSNLKGKVKHIYKCTSIRRALVYKLIVLPGILFRSGAELHYFQKNEETTMP